MKFQYWIMAVLALTAVSAQAQYKYVGPDGRVIYSDSPPPAGAKGVQKKDLGSSPTVSSAGGGSSLPYAIGLAAKNFPVTLYTTPGCEGCDQGRSYLSKRGIPFSEKTVTSNEDLQAIKKLTGSGGLPVLTVGNTKLLGFDPTSWGSNLDNAGYPSTNSLPPGYRQPAPTALVPKKPEAAPAKTAEASPPAAETTSSASAPAQTPPPAPEPARPSWFRGF